jgi:hypothetical protein
MFKFDETESNDFNSTEFYYPNAFQRAVTLKFVSYDTKNLFEEFVQSLSSDIVNHFGKPLTQIENILEAYRLHFEDEKNNDIFWQVLINKGRSKYNWYLFPLEF